MWATSLRYSRWFIRSYSCSSMMLSTFSWKVTKLLSTIACPLWFPRVIRKSSSFAYRCSGVSLYAWRPPGLGFRAPPPPAERPPLATAFGRFCTTCEVGFCGGRFAFIAAAPPSRSETSRLGFTGFIAAPHCARLRSSRGADVNSGWLLCLCPIFALTLARGSACA